jgi:hypothetical protein
MYHLELRLEFYKIKNLIYQTAIWYSASFTHIQKIQVLPNRTLRITINKPLYVRNIITHRDIQLPFEIDILHNIYS